MSLPNSAFIQAFIFFFLLQVVPTTAFPETDPDACEREMSGEKSGKEKRFDTTLLMRTSSWSSGSTGAAVPASASLPAETASSLDEAKTLLHTSLATGLSNLAPGEDTSLSGLTLRLKSQASQFEKVPDASMPYLLPDLLTEVAGDAADSYASPEQVWSATFRPIARLAKALARDEIDDDSTIQVLHLLTLAKIALLEPPGWWKRRRLNVWLPRSVREGRMGPWFNPPEGLSRDAYEECLRIRKILLEDHMALFRILRILNFTMIVMDREGYAVGSNNEGLLLLLPRPNVSEQRRDHLTRGDPDEGGWILLSSYAGTLANPYAFSRGSPYIGKRIRVLRNSDSWFEGELLGSVNDAGTIIILRESQTGEVILVNSASRPLTAPLLALFGSRLDAVDQLNARALREIQFEPPPSVSTADLHSDLRPGQTVVETPEGASGITFEFPERYLIDFGTHSEILEGTPQWGPRSRGGGRGEAFWLQREDGQWVSFLQSQIRAHTKTTPRS